MITNENSLCINLSNKFILDDFDEKSINYLEKFIKHVNNLCDEPFDIQNISKVDMLNLKFELDNPKINMVELRSFMMRLRPLILDQEKSSFKSILKYIKNFNNDEINSKIKMIEKIFDDGLFSLYMKFNIGEFDLFDKKTFSYWLNGLEYHTDENKEKQWYKLESIISENSAKAYLMHMLYSKFKAICTLSCCINKLLNKD